MDLNIIAKISVWSSLPSIDNIDDHVNRHVNNLVLESYARDNTSEYIKCLTENSKPIRLQPKEELRIVFYWKTINPVGLGWKYGRYRVDGQDKTNIRVSKQLRNYLIMLQTSMRIREKSPLEECRHEKSHPSLPKFLSWTNFFTASSAPNTPRSDRKSPRKSLLKSPRISPRSILDSSLSPLVEEPVAEEEYEEYGPIFNLMIRKIPCLLGSVTTHRRSQSF